MLSFPMTSRVMYMLSNPSLSSVNRTGTGVRLWYLRMPICLNFVPALLGVPNFVPRAGGGEMSLDATDIFWL